MAEFHFVEDYERHVKALIKAFPIDEAMSLAVGGDYDRIGGILANILAYSGIQNGMSVVDLGCGSGRVAKSLSKNFDLNYLGIDVIKDLVDYAASVCPSNYKFKINRKLSIPARAESVDLVFAFSVFTHLLHEETYLYLEDIWRTLKPGGTVVFSFLEFRMKSHWGVFSNTVEQQRASTKTHLNMFIERNQIEAWADHLGFKIQEFVSGDIITPNNKEALGQSTVIIKKPLEI